MLTGLKPEDLGDLLQQPVIAVLATRRRDDTVLLSPVWFDWQDGGINVWVDGEQNGKIRHIRRDPRVSIVIANATWPYKGLEIRGEATISPEGFYDVLRRTGDRYLGPGNGERMVSETPPGLVIRIEPGDLRAWDYVDEA
jgi:PPOX class probable F420-dependent enzyme